MYKKNEKGFLLISAFLFAAMLSTVSLGLATRHVAFLQAAERNKNRMVAFHMAEAAMDTAITQLKTNSSYSGVSYFTSLSTGNIEGGYTVAVCPPACTGLTQPADPNVRLIVATGEAPSNISTATGYETRSVSSYVRLTTGSSFAYSVFAKNGISLVGNAATDSYNSTNGAYDPLTAGTNGDLGTDSIAAGSISLTGNATVRGDVTIGPSGNTATVISTTDNATITGARNVALSAQNPTAASTSVASEGALSVSGNTTYNLSAGTHRFSSLSISGNGSINAGLGAVVIYVDGSVSISGNGFATQANKPPNLIIYVTGSSNVSISGNGNFYGAIHAPNSAISNTGNGTIYGAVVGSTYNQTGNGAIHYDEALESVNGNAGTTVQMKSWIERNTAFN